MNNIIEHTYTSLANTDELRLTKKDYSMNYLGRCKSYYVYLKSTGRQASTDVLLKLWAQLRLAEKQAKARNKIKYDFFKKTKPSHLQKTASELSNKILGEILARCKVCSTHNSALKLC